MVEAATEFRKSGFNDEDAANLALVATQYQNVADDAISAGEASNFIISQIKAFGIEANNAQHIIDALNEVSNNFAVSSSDLSNNLGKASAALATGNTTYEETLGLFTGITEITRNASRAARGLVSIQSRLTQVLDDQSSTGKALIDIYDGLGIELFDSNGQIRSLYDILADLNKQWDGLSTNQKDYIALTQAGSNQTQNFLALMSNFETVTNATSTALNSTGSAMEENARVMESLEARTNQLKATFQDLSNNVIENELIKSLLDLANKALGVLNTEVGTAITQFGLLTAGLTGLIGVGKYFLPLITGATGFMSGPLGWAAGIGAIVTVVYQLYKAWDEAIPTLEEANTRLEENEARLEEISQLGWYDRTPEIQAEEEALRAENEQLKEYIANTEKAKRLNAKDTGVQIVTGHRYQVTDESGVAQGYAQTREQAEALAKQFGILNYQIQELDTTTTLYGQEAVHHLVGNLFDLRTILEKNGALNDEQMAQYNKLIPEAEVYADTLEATGQDAGALRLAIELLQKQFNIAKGYAQGFNGELTITHDGAQQLIKLFPELEGNLNKNAVGWKALASDISTAASSMISSNGRIYKSDKDRVVETIKLLKAEAESHRLIAKAKYNAARAGKISYAEVHAAFDAYDAYTEIISELNTALSASLRSGFEPDPSPNPPKVIDDVKDKLEDDTEDAQAKLEEIRKSQQEALENYRQEYERAVQYIIGLIDEEITALEEERATEEDYWDKKIEALNEANKALEDQINLEKLQDNLAKSRQSKVLVYKDGRYQYIQDIDEVSAAQSELEAYERQQALEKETKRLNKLKDESVAAINKQIAKWKEYAKSWEDIVDGYTKEQDKLLAKQHLGIDTEKSNWNKRLKNADDFAEEYKSIMEALAKYTTDSFTSQGTTLESLLKDQETVLNNAIKTQEKYYQNSIALRDKFNEALLAGQKVGDVGLWLDWNKAAASGGGWTEKEMAEGFLPPTTNVPSGYREGTTSSGEKVNIKMDSSSGHAIARPSTEKRTDLAGQSVTVNGNKVTYNDRGYVESIKKLAVGTLSAQGGISLVGEQGPELRVLGHGDGIIPADITKNLWAWGSITPASMLSALNGGLGMGKSMAVTIQNLNLPNVKDGNDFVQYMKNNFWRQTVQFATT